MILPPTVCGMLLLLLFGKSTAIGRFLISCGIDIAFTWPAAVVSAVVVSFPYMYRTARGAFEALDAEMLDAARVLGWKERRIFLKIMLPLSTSSLVAGAALAFARALGEFGATMFFAGNYVGETQTLPVAIYYDWMAGDAAATIFWVIAVMVFSFATMLLMNRVTRHAGRQ